MSQCFILTGEMVASRQASLRALNALRKIAKDLNINFAMNNVMWTDNVPYLGSCYRPCR